MEYSGRVNLSCIIPDIPSFALFGVEIFTQYSRTILPRRYSDFHSFHRQLCLFAYSPYKNKSLIDEIPHLPSDILTQESHLVELQATELTNYINSVLGLLDNSSPWTDFVKNFFEIPRIHKLEQKNATMIQRYFRNYIRYQSKRQLVLRQLSSNGWVVNLAHLPDHILLEIFGFFNVEQLCKLACVNKHWSKITKNPLLWRTLDLFNSEKSIKPSLFAKICERAWQLRVIDLRFCDYITEQSLYTISQACNPSSLSELYLDACENVDNHALSVLVSKFARVKPSCPFKGGARGLQVLSLGECRKVSEDGLTKLRKLVCLRSLNLLGCVHINDEAVALLVLGSPFLEELNLSGTSITKMALMAIRQNCLNLKKLWLNACRNLGTSDASVFIDIQVQINEDAIRFYLRPSKDSELVKFTNNVLRTRSSLSIHRIAQFVQRRLQIDREVDILHNDAVMSHHTSLSQIPHQGDTLSLTYRLQEETLQAQINSARNKWVGRIPEWMPDSNLCMRCDRKFFFWVRRHHCRLCGKVVCSNCSKHKKSIPALGFSQKKARVCNFCAGTLK